MQHPINALENIKMVQNAAFYLFSLPRQTVNNFNTAPFIAMVTATIQNGHRNHTVLIAEEPSHRMEDAVNRTIDTIAAVNRKHRVHAFLLTSGAFKEFIEENRGYFMEQYILESLTDDWQNHTEIREKVALKMCVSSESLVDLVPYHTGRMRVDRMLEVNSDADEKVHKCRRLQENSDV